MKVANKEKKRDAALLGAADKSGEENFLQTSGYFLFELGASNHMFGPEFVLGQKFDIEYSTINSGDAYLIANGETISFTPKSTARAGGSLYLFARHNSSGAGNYISMAVYSCEIYDENQDLVRSFIPCYNKNLNELGEEFGYGLYDTVTEEFYGNAGSGKFVGKSFLEEGETCKVFDYEQYFVDHEMVNDISTTTITGTGTKTDPYIINSSEDFWWASKFASWQNVYINFACDIYLNDEKLNSEGMSLDGDGLIYQHSCDAFKNLKNAYVDGNTHNIFGLYFQNEEYYSNLKFGLFQSSQKQIENLTVANYYINAKVDIATAFCANVVKNMRNCVVGKGEIRNQSRIAAFCVEAGIYNESGEMRDCINYANLLSDTGNCSGMAINCSRMMSFVNCVNYGDFDGDRVGGICAYLTYISIRCYNCINYGNLIGKGSSGGGILGFVYDCKEVIIENCENYGEIAAYYDCAGILGISYQNSRVTIRNCVNQGRIQSGTGYGYELMGRTRTLLADANRVSTIIENCKVLPHKQQQSFFNLAEDFGCVHVCAVRNCVYEASDIIYWTSVLGRNTTNTTMSNILIRFKDKLCSIFNSKQYISVGQIKNIYIEVQNNTQNPKLFSNTTSNMQVSLENIVIRNLKRPELNCYYGSDFSGFNLSWKTGVISLNSMSNMSSFAPRLTEENLIGMGFQKKTI